MTRASTGLSCSRQHMLLLLLGAAAATQASAQGTCRVSYSSSTKLPLLFGGVNQGCQGLRCQARYDAVGQKCGARDGSSWGVCTTEQATQALSFARSVLGESGVNLSPCELMPYLQGRTLWLLGDSHTKTLWSALQCFLMDFWDHTVCAASPDEAAVNELAELTHKVKGHSNCIHLLGPAGGRVCIVEVVLGTSLVGNPAVAGGGVLPLLRAKFARPEDVFYVNFGAWHRKNLADMATFEPALEALGKDYVANKAVWPHVLFRENSALHPKDLERKVCMPNEGYTFVPGQPRLQSTAAADADESGRYTMGRPLTDLVQQVLPKYGISIVSSFNYTVPLFNQHIEMRHVDALDCLHFCSPGVPQMWIHDLFTALRSGQGGVKPLQPVSRVPGFGGSSTITEERGPGRAGSSAQQQQPGGGRLMEVLRRGLGRRRLQEEEEHAGVGVSSGRQLLQAQRHQCVRSKVTF